MEFATPQEAAAYRMLRHALQNHITTYAIAFDMVLCMAVAWLGNSCLQLSAAGVKVSPLIAEITRGLKQAMRAQHGQLVLQPFAFDRAIEAAPDEPLGAKQRDQTFGDLWQLLAEASVEERIFLPGALRITTSLMADLLSVLLYDDHFEYELDEIDTVIDARIIPALQDHIRLHASYVTPRQGP
jgi:hypothetical protein